MKQRLIRLLAAVLPILLTPALALARRYEEEKEIVDARLEGFVKDGKAVDVTLQGGGTALTWLLLVFLAVLCVAALFKNAKRTHLD